MEKLLRPDRSQMAIWRMRIECIIPKAINTLSEYIMVISFSSATMVTLNS